MSWRRSLPTHTAPKSGTTCSAGTRWTTDWYVGALTQQALRFVFLLLESHYRIAPPQTRLQAVRHPTVFVVSRLLAKSTRLLLSKWLMILSEGIANVRRLALMALWLYLGGKHVAPRAAAPGADDDDDDHASTTERLALAGEVLAGLGEGCDVLAFLTGSGLFWRALGLRRRPQGWMQRRRRGLERVGVFVSLAALLVQLGVTARRNDEITEDMGRSVQTMQTQLEAFDAAAAHGDPAPADVRPTDEASVRTHVEAEYVGYLHSRRRLRWLGIERVCLCADAGFTLYEAWAPDRDKDFVEASTGLLAAVLRLLRLWNEARFGSLDL